ncbi:MAG TPA: hypothetical protein VHB98_01310, partial [Chloroflexota bacterium]|nr:hypothetical protein [Chloroflexota bacterium]
VQQSVVPLEGRRHIKGPKNKESRRSKVVLDRELIGCLTEHRESQRERRKRLGDAWEDNDLVVASAVGTPIVPTNVARERDRIVARSGVRRIRVHDLRHTYGTLLHRNRQIINQLIRRLVAG